MIPGPSSKRRGWVLGALLTLAACDFNTPAPEAPPRTINFPVAVDVVPTAAGRSLIVASSNLTLRFDSSSVLAFDLDSLYATLDAQCAGGVCTQPIDTSLFDNVSEVLAPPQVDGIAVSPALGDPTLDGPRRVYFPLRRRPWLAWVDIDANGVLLCDEQISDGYCGGIYTDYDSSVAAERGLEIPPSAIEAVTLRVAGDDANDYLVMIHAGTTNRLGGASLFRHRREAGAQPELIDVLFGLPTDTISAALSPATDEVWLVGAPRSGTAQQIVAVGVGENATGERRLYSVIQPAILGLAGGSDLRDLVFDPEPSRNRVWILGRNPPAIIPLDLDSDTLLAGTPEAVIPAPSRLTRIEIEPLPPEEREDPSSVLAPRAYLVATSYEGGFIYIVDAETGRLAHTVGGFSGPLDLAYDPVGRHLFVAGFRDSVLRVVDLSPLAPGAGAVTDELQIRATIGEPYALGVFR